jgi:hypothetical protein
MQARERSSYPRMRGLSFVVSKDGRTTFTLEWTPLSAAAEECELFDSFCEGMAIDWKGTFEHSTRLTDRVCRLPRFHTALGGGSIVFPPPVASARWLL